MWPQQLGARELRQGSPRRESTVEIAAFVRFRSESPIGAERVLERREEAEPAHERRSGPDRVDRSNVALRRVGIVEAHEEIHEPSFHMADVRHLLKPDDATRSLERGDGPCVLGGSSESCGVS